MAHPTLDKARKNLVEELEALVKKHKKGIEFKGTIVFVDDPIGDSEYDERIGIEKLRYDKRDDVVYAEGATYDEGIRLDEADSIAAEDLSLEEIACLIETAESSLA